MNPSEPGQDTPGLVGAALLDALLAALIRFVVLPTPEAADAVVLWIAASHAQPAWAHAPRMVVCGPEKRCGKSRLLDIAEGTCHQPLITVNASSAAVYRSIDALDPPTLLVDEADAIFGGKNADANEDLRGLLNAGHQRNRPALRWDVNTRRVEEFATFAMAALAGIGAMPDTIEDRAVIIRMRRRAPTEDVAPFRHKRDGPTLHALRRQLRGWLRPHVDDLEAAEPAMPVEDRAADTWEPLIAVADLAGDDWPDRGRAAVLALTADHDDTTKVSLRNRLLVDCRTAFGDLDAIATNVLLQRLRADDEAPWATLGPTGLTPAKLGNLLRDYEIRSQNIRFPRDLLDEWGIRTDSNQVKGYLRADFTDAWDRYCPPVSALNDHGPMPELSLWDGSSRPTSQGVPGLTCEVTAGTAGTAPPREAICIQCRTPLSYDDGSHTHPNCGSARPAHIQPTGTGGTDQ